MNDHTAPRSAMEVGKALDRLVKASTGELDPGQTLALMSALVSARCETPADVLACVAHGNDLVRQACKLLEDPDMPPDPGDVSRLLLWSMLLNSRALDTLEGFTGLPASGFLGTGPTMN